MNPAAVIAQLKAAGVHVAVADGKLELEGPERVLNEDVLNELRAIKAELIKFLNDNPASQAEGIIDGWRAAIASVKPNRPEIDKLKTVSLRFLDSPDAVAAVYHGWDALSLLGMHEGNCPRERLDAWGLVLFLAWGIHNCTVESIDQKVCALRTRSGAVQTLRCNRANFVQAVPWWQHSGIVNAGGGGDDPDCA